MYIHIQHLHIMRLHEEVPLRPQYATFCTGTEAQTHAGTMQSELPFDAALLFELQIASCSG